MNRKSTEVNYGPRQALIILLLVGLAVTRPSLAGEEIADERPNIVLIMADDMGSEVLGTYGGSSYETPNLEALARGGIRFTHCYSTPKCSPSRKTLATGRYVFRIGGRWGYLPRDEITFGKTLQSAGYRTAVAGKWHFGLLADDPGQVSHFGFDEHCLWAWHEGPRYWQPRIWQNERVLDNVEQEYGPNVYNRFLIEFIKRNQDRPFFVYYPMCLPHFPKSGKKHKEPTGPNGRYESYKEMMENMDRLVGELVRVLEDLNLREKTLVLFTSDNGSPQRVVSMRDGKLVQGGKSLFNDRGTRVPLIANWPGKTPQGIVDKSLIDFTDFLPTLADLAGARLPDVDVIDGSSFAARLFGRGESARQWAFNIYKDQETGRDKGWIRNREWKLYLNGELYEMSSDPEEEQAIFPETDNHASSAARQRLQAGLFQILFRY